jgi:hypothetical protein
MWWGALTGVVVISAALWGPIASNVEQPQYKVVDTDRGFEIREYPPMIVAEVDVSGEQKKAIGEGFRIIAEYIFGKNLSSQKVAMTAPVMQQKSEMIRMTSPVTQQAVGDVWRVQFIMPASYTMQTLLKPKNADVKLREVVGKRFAVIRFSGLAGEDRLKSHTAELENFLSARKLTAVSAPAYAFYNPPWTLPFMRRNEVMIEISR